MVLEHSNSDSYSDRQPNIQTEKQTDIPTDRQTHRKTDTLQQQNSTG